MGSDRPMLLDLNKLRLIYPKNTILECLFDAKMDYLRPLFILKIITEVEKRCWYSLLLDKKINKVKAGFKGQSLTDVLGKNVLN